MKFGSWTYDGFKVDLKLKAEAGDLGTYTNNGEWDLLSETNTKEKYERSREHFREHFREHSRELSKITQRTCWSVLTFAERHFC